MEEDAAGLPAEAASGGGDIPNVPTLSELFANQEFHVAAAFGALVVIIDALRRYNEIAFDARPNDVIFSMSPRFLSTSADYLNSFVLYIVLRLLTYAVPALAILYIFSEQGMSEALGIGLPEYFAQFITHENFPLFWGAVIAGVLPTFSFVRDIERSMRRSAQLAGGIPSGVRRLVRTLRVAPLTPVGGVTRAMLSSDRFALVDAEDFGPGANRIDRKWARICYILDFFEERGAKDVIRAEFHDTYRDEMDREQARFRSLQIRFAIHKLGYDKVRELFDAESVRNLPRTISTHDPFLEPDIDYLLDRLETYLAAATRYSENGEEEAIDALRKSGFAVIRPRGRGQSPFGGLLATLAALVAATVIGCASAYYLVVLLDNQGVLAFPYDVVAGETVVDRIVGLMSYQLIIVSAVVFTGFLLGAIMFKISSSEPETRPFTERPVVKYVLSSLVGAFFGLMAMTAMIASSSPDLEAGQLDWIIRWGPSLFVLCLGVHVFAYGPDRGVGRLLSHGVIIGIAYAAAVYLTSHNVFTRLGVFEPQIEGAALYFGVVSFWTGLFVSTAVIYLHKRQRDYRLQALAVAEAEELALHAPPAPALEQTQSQAQTPA